MNKKEFQAHIEERINALTYFSELVLEHQKNKNEKRQKKNRWNEAKVERAAKQDYQCLIDNIYLKVKSIVEKNSKQSKSVWLKTMDEQNIYESISEAVYEIELED